jgi:hypothetical protein
MLLTLSPQQKEISETERRNEGHQNFHTTRNNPLELDSRKPNFKNLKDKK